MTGFLKNFVRDEEGASLVEYTVLIGLVTAATIGLISTVGGKVTFAWNRLNNNMTGSGFE
ncbi:Flp family type IVb pilin [Microvirga sp. G4-2]|uniref:Flp family type IVb pilin n=1 Tax=Microvirga sp. G4-2 TaxID=3434467 RepID=UPI004044C818